MNSVKIKIERVEKLTGVYSAKFRKNKENPKRA